MNIHLKELINPTIKQEEFFKATLDYLFVLYGGAAGGGKSYSLRWWCVRELLRLYALTGQKNIRVGLFCETYGELVDRQVSKIKLEFPEWLGTCTKSQTEGFNFKLKDEFGGGTIALRNLDNPEKYKSTEFAAIAVEELTHNTEDVFTALRSRLRWPGVERPKFAAATNPGGIGHAWVRQLWIDQDFPEHMKAIAHEFKFIPALVSDNPHVDPEYKRLNLDTLPEQERKALAEGDWNQFSGQYFTQWREEVHAIAPIEIPWYWKIERVGDWGEAAPCAILWIATDTEGFKYVIGEVYGKGMSIERQAALIHAFEKGKNIQKVGILDSACFTTSGMTRSLAEQYEDYGVRWTPSAKGPGSRIPGWRMIRKALQFERDADGRVQSPPNLRVFKTCTNLIRTLPSLIHDKHKVEDLDTKGDDHLADALRYHFYGAASPITPDSEMDELDASQRAYALKEYGQQYQPQNSQWNN
ncbi:terminase family protein [soil metagenome]